MAKHSSLVVRRATRITSPRVVPFDSASQSLAVFVNPVVAGEAGNQRLVSFSVPVQYPGFKISTPYPPLTQWG